MWYLYAVDELYPTLNQAERLHNTVPWGDGKTIFSQLMEIGELLVFQTEYNENWETVAKAALLHKSIDPRYVNPGMQPWTLEEIEWRHGKKVRAIVEELASEPQSWPGHSQDEIWKAKAEWAKGLSTEAQQILIAEKLMNFQTSIHYPNPDWTPQDHLDYFETRMVLLDAIQDASPELYQAAVMLREEGVNMYREMIREQENRRKPPGADRPRPPSPF